MASLTITPNHPLGEFVLLQLSALWHWRPSSLEGVYSLQGTQQRSCDCFLDIWAPCSETSIQEEEPPFFQGPFTTPQEEVGLLLHSGSRQINVWPTWVPLSTSLSNHKYKWTSALLHPANVMVTRGSGPSGMRVWSPELAAEGGEGFRTVNQMGGGEVTISSVAALRQTDAMGHPMYVPLLSFPSRVEASYPRVSAPGKKMKKGIRVEQEIDCRRYGEHTAQIPSRKTCCPA